MDNEHRTLTIRLFDEYENTELTGIVVLIHTFRREIKLSMAEGECHWIKIDEIENKLRRPHLHFEVPPFLWTVCRL
ncbi:YolD-like family protein [Paenibacillus sp. Cedars]|uniref:YolD-like family protein n=1 Tax=Paenibacillus sp. Cedars TaxID=1980674 RepID=UPI0011655B9C|nr:YolD-like family protein [Paenibacillus sp. Cedars]AWP30804.1 hypothetical protein B9D94_05765 [Paenibacillus sp. Cedars]